MSTFESAARAEAGAAARALRSFNLDKSGDIETEGYPKLARLMANFPDYAIFRRFGYLSILNLMRFQAELAQLEVDLEMCQIQGQVLQRGMGPGHTYSTSFAELERESPEQLQLMKRSAKVLQEYSEQLSPGEKWPVLIFLQMPSFYKVHKSLHLQPPMTRRSMICKHG
jgi:hypothetical protein